MTKLNLLFAVVGILASQFVGAESCEKRIASPANMIIDGTSKWAAWPRFDMMEVEPPKVIMWRISRRMYDNPEGKEHHLVHDFIQQAKPRLVTKEGPYLMDSDGSTARVTARGQLQTGFHNNVARFFRGLNGKLYAKFRIGDGIDDRWFAVIEVEVNEETGAYSNPKTLYFATGHYFYR